MDNEGFAYSAQVCFQIVPSRYRSWVQTAIGVGASFSAVTALLGMGKFGAVVSSLFHVELLSFIPGAAINADPVDGWRWIFRSSLIGNVIITIGFFVFYKVSHRDQSHLHLTCTQIQTRPT